jgi:peptide/nickel transport system substrate-binding protein
MGKKKFKLLAAIFIAVALLTSGAMAQAADKLVLGVDTPPRTMNPHGSNADSNIGIMSNIFDGLLQRVGAAGKLEPALATKFEHPDLLTWKFYLRKGVKFHNGNDFTAADVKFSFERLSDPKVSEWINTGKSIASIETPDDHTVIIKTVKPIPWFANNMHQIHIMDKESTENRDEGEVGLKPIGTGAYKMVEWVKGSYVKFEANENYWEGAPAIKHVELRPIKESSTRFAALASGQVDIVSGVPVQLYDKLIKNPKLEVIKKPARRCIFLALGNEPGTPTADVRVRKAMYMAINEDEIIKKIMRGHASPAAQVPDPPTIGYNPNLKRLPYDPAKAKALLKEAGYEKGFEITLAGPNDRYVQDAQIAEAVVKYLAKVGIKAKLDVKPKSIFFPEVTNGKHKFYLIGWFDGTFDMGRTYFKLIRTYDKEKGVGAWNGTRFSDAKLDKLLDSTADIVDPAERKKTLQEVNRLAMEDAIAWIPLHYQVDLYAMQKDKGIGFSPRPDRWLIYKEIKKK